jgi:hypothetical protein
MVALVQLLERRSRRQMFEEKTTGVKVYMKYRSRIALSPDKHVFWSYLLAERREMLGSLRLAMNGLLAQRISLALSWSSRGLTTSKPDEK